jgi:hypothetical protein
VLLSISSVARKVEVVTSNSYTQVMCKPPVHMNRNPSVGGRPGWQVVNRDLAVAVTSPALAEVFLAVLAGDWVRGHDWSPSAGHAGGALD